MTAFGRSLRWVSGMPTHASRADARDTWEAFVSALRTTMAMQRAVNGEAVEVIGELLVGFATAIDDAHIEHRASRRALIACYEDGRRQSAAALDEVFAHLLTFETLSAQGDSAAASAGLLAWLRGLRIGPQREETDVDLLLPTRGDGGVLCWEEEERP